METFRDFLRAYNKSDIYMVSSAWIPGWLTVRPKEAPRNSVAKIENRCLEVPKKMMKEVEFLSCMSCGG